MKNQFFYTYKNEKNEDVIGSFNVNKVIRSLSRENGGLAVYLDDFNNQPMPVNVPVGKKVEMQMRNQTVFSEIMLELDDANRFKSLTEIGTPLEIPLGEDISYTLPSSGLIESNIG